MAMCPLGSVCVGIWERFEFSGEITQDNIVGGLEAVS